MDLSGLYWVWNGVNDLWRRIRHRPMASGLDDRDGPYFWRPLENPKKNKQTKQQQLKSRRFRYCVPIRRRKDIGGVLGFQIGFRSAAFERISKMFVTVSGRNSIYFKQTIGILFRVEDVGLAVRFQRRPFPPIPRMNGQLQARSPTSVWCYPRRDNCDLIFFSISLFSCSVMASFRSLHSPMRFCRSFQWRWISYIVSSRRKERRRLADSWAGKKFRRGRIPQRMIPATNRKRFSRKENKKKIQKKKLDQQKRRSTHRVLFSFLFDYRVS